MAITAAQFQASVDKFSTNMHRLNGIVNGGSSVEIGTDHGPVPSIAKFMDNVLAQLNDLPATTTYTLEPATEGQTSFPLPFVANGKPVVYVDGLRLSETAFSLVGNSLLLDVGVAAGAELIVLPNDLGSVGDTTAENVSFIQADAEAVARTVRDKLRETVSIEDFAPPGLAWNADWTGVFTKAAVSVGPGGIVRANGRYTLFGNPYIPFGVSVVGPYTCPDQIRITDGSDYDSRNGVVFIRPTSTGVNVNGDGGWEGLIIMREGLDLPFANAAAAAAGVAAFAGTAFNAAGPGATFRNLLILGFNKAIYSGGQERLRCVGIRGDCTNGIDVRAAYDIPEIEDCHFWPYTTVHQSWTTNALLRRTGTAFYGEGVNDWMRWVRCFSFGYFRGFHGRNVNTVTFFLCGADNTSTAGVGDHAGSIGFVIDGICEDPRWIACQAAAQEVGFFYGNNGKHGTMAFCEAWACSVAGLDRRSGNLTVTGGVLRGAGYGILNEHATDFLSYSQVRFNNIVTKPVHSTVTTSGVRDHGGNDYGDWPVGDSPVTNTVVIASIPSADPLLLPATGDEFIVTGTVGHGTISGMWAGRKVTLIYTGALQVSDGGASLLLQGNLLTGGNATLSLIGLSGGVARETGRSVL